MQEHNFIVELNKVLGSMPATQREDVLQDYRAHVFEARERGKTDEQIADALGDPKTIGRTIVADYHMNRISQPSEGQKLSTSLYHMIRAFFVLISILAFNFFFMLWPILGMAIALGVLWILAGVAVFVGLILGFAALLGNMVTPVAIGIFAKLAISFYSFSVFGFALLSCFALYFSSRFFLMSLLKYIKLNAKVIQPK
ncbi:MAG: DUF1700 domain-containing protein [Proteobacteria bacterium]|nr:DUF1700 domain-containing protein [Pseudomonadota bacterium]